MWLVLDGVKTISRQSCDIGPRTIVYKAHACNIILGHDLTLVWVGETSQLQLHDRL